jgi:hypothetical protein
MGFVKFMASTAGRTLRVIVGAAVLVWGIAAGLVWLDLLGVFFIAVGLFDVCIFGPLVGKAFSGKKLREQLK